MIFVVILAYNEAGGIEAFLKDLDKSLKLQKDSYRLVVVNDGSTDGTREKVEALKGMPVVLLNHEKNMGVGKAFDTGLRYAADEAAEDDVVVTMEGDQTNDPINVLDLVRKAKENFDVVCASRYQALGRYVGFPWSRHFFSFCANWSMRIAFPIEGVRDYTIFFRAYRARLLRESIQRYGQRFIERSGFTSNAEILFKVAQVQPSLRAAEVPIVYRYDLKKGNSKMRIIRNIREYGILFARLAVGPLGVGLRQTAALLSAGLAVGLYGMTWGLPSAARLDTLLSPELRNDARLVARLDESYKRLYEKLDANQRLPVDVPEERVSVPAGWKFPPDVLLNSIRSFLIRSENPDEQKTLSQLARMKPSRLDFEPYWVDYGGAYLYPLGVYYAALKLAGAIDVSSELAIYLSRPSAMAGVFAAGRVWNSLSLAASAAVLASLARLLGSPSIGWTAGFLFLLLPVTAIVSHTLNPYGWATLWSLAGMRCVFGFLKRERRADLLRAGGAFGLAFGSSIAFWPLPGALWLAALHRLLAEKPRRWRFLGWALQASAITAAIFVITNPYLVFKFKQYEPEFRYLNGFPMELSWAHLKGFMTEFLSFNMGIGAAWAAVLGAAYFSFRDVMPAGLRLCSWMFLLGFVQLSMRITDPGHGRHFLPFIAFGCLVVAHVAHWAVRAFNFGLGWALVAAFLIPTAASSTTQLWNMRQEAEGNSTRIEAAKWINQSLPAGAEIGLVAPPQPVDCPPFRLDRFRLAILDSAGRFAEKDPPQFMVVSETRMGPELRGLLTRRYELIQVFAAPRLYPTVRMRSEYSGVNARMEIWRRR